MPPKAVSFTWAALALVSLAVLVGGCATAVRCVCRPEYVCDVDSRPGEVYQTQPCFCDDGLMRYNAAPYGAANRTREVYIK